MLKFAAGKARLTRFGGQDALRFLLSELGAGIGQQAHTLFIAGVADKARHGLRFSINRRDCLTRPDLTHSGIWDTL